MSLMRTIRPWSSFLTMMFSNCSGVDSRPSVLSVIWIGWPLATGGWPIWPAATWTFCSCRAATTSAGVRLRRGQLVGIDPDAHAVIALAEEQARR